MVEARRIRGEGIAFSVPPGNGPGLKNCNIIFEFSKFEDVFFKSAIKIDLVTSMNF